MVWLLALACGVAVGNVYFPQAITPLIAEGLGVSADSTALVVSAVQFGYAAGIFLLVPLGDRFAPRPLLCVLLGLTGLGLLAAGLAPALPPLVGVAALVGSTTVLAPIIGPMAAGMVAEQRRGVVSGTLLGGSIAGMLASRAFGGSLGELLGWRAPYLLAAAVTLVLAGLLAAALPRGASSTRQRYPALLGSALWLLRAEPELRRSCAYQACLFAAFTAVWASVALLLTGPAYRLGAHAVGLLALVNLATMLATPIAGRQVDRRGSDPVNTVTMLGVLASAVLLFGAGLGGVHGIVALVAGTLVLDVAMQCGMVANQVRIYALRADARSRMNTAYMTVAYLGGSLGSWLGVLLYARFGWPGVCGLVAVLAALALLRHAVHLGRRVRAGTG